MLRIQSTVYPPCRIQNKVKEGGLWYADEQNAILAVSNDVLKIHRSNSKKRFMKRLIIIAIILDIIALIQIIS